MVKRYIKGADGLSIFPYYLINHWQTSIIWATHCLEGDDVHRAMKDLILQLRCPKLRDRKC